MLNMSIGNLACNRSNSVFITSVWKCRRHSTMYTASVNTTPEINQLTGVHNFCPKSGGSDFSTELDLAGDHGVYRYAWTG